MFFPNDTAFLELLGVFKIDRGEIKRKSTDNRIYDSLSFRMSGSCCFSFNGEKYYVGSNEALYIPANASYTQHTTGESVIAIHFINHSYTPSRKIEIMSIENIDEIKKLVLEMYKLWKEKNKGYKYICLSLFYKLIYIINVQNHVNDTYDSDTKLTFKKAVEYIHQNYRNEDLCVTDLSKMISVSDSYFRRIFKDLYSMSPSQYIIKLRLEYASQLLQSHLYSVLEISQKSGFKDVKYFSRIFKKHYGIVPNKYKYLNVEDSFE